MIQGQTDHCDQSIVGIEPIKDQEPATWIASDPLQIQEGVPGIGRQFRRVFQCQEHSIQFVQFCLAAASFRLLPVPQGLTSQYQAALYIRQIFLFQAFQPLGSKGPHLFPHGLVHYCSSDFP